MASDVGVVPELVLLRKAGSAGLAPATAETVCCLRSTTPGVRAVVYRSAADQGVIGVLDFVSGAAPRGGRGWEADGVFQPVEPYLPRAALLDDPELAAVFTHLQSRRRLPADAGRRLAALLPDLPFAGG